MEILKPFVAKQAREQAKEMRKAHVSNPISELQDLSKDSHTIDGCSLSGPEWYNLTSNPLDAQGPTDADDYNTNKETNEEDEEEEENYSKEEDVPDSYVLDNQAPSLAMPTQATTSVIVTRPPTTTPPSMATTPVQ